MEDGPLKTILTGILIAVVIAVIVAIVGLRAFYGLSTLSQVTVVNRSVETISEARLRQADRETTLGRIEPGQMRSADFMPREGSLTLTVTFSSGRTLSAENVGYVAPGIPVTVFFNVTDDTVALLDVVKRNTGTYSKR
jgi:hypothetical protein